MTPENFIYWINGFLEIGNPTEINSQQTQEIKNHLALVLNKVTPNLNSFDYNLKMNWSWMYKDLKTNQSVNLLEKPDLTGYEYRYDSGGYVNPNNPYIVYIAPCASC